MPKLSQSGSIPVLILFAVVGVVASLLIYSSAPFKDRMLTTLYPKADSKAATADWGPETHMNIFGGVVYISSAASGNTVHLMSGTGFVTGIRSTNEGDTWSGLTNIGSGTIDLDDPVVADGQNVYVAAIDNQRQLNDWCCTRDIGNIFMRISRDGGQTYGAAKQISTNQGAFRISVAVSGTNVYVVWMDFRSQTTWDLYYRKSTDSGNTWGPETKLVSGVEPVGPERPQIVAEGNTLHVAWMDGRDNNPGCYTMPHCPEVYYKRSTDNGTTWGANTRLTFGKKYASRPDIGASNGVVMVAYDHQYDPVNDPSNQEIYTIRSTDDGATWGTPVRMSNAPADSEHDVLMMDRNYAHLAWFDRRNPNTSEVYYRMSSDYGATWGPEEKVSTGGGNGSTPLLAATTNYLHVIWSDSRSGSNDMWYRRRNLTSGPPASPTPTPSSAPSPSIAPSPSPAGIAAPTVNTSAFCSNQVSGINISWTTSGILFNQIATDPAFSTWYNKDLTSTPGQSTTAPNGFTLRQTTPVQPLTFTQGQSYYVRIWDGTNISPVTSFTIPVCTSPSPSPTSSPKPGDVDGNNKVDIFDFNILLTNFGKSGTGIQGDLDKNGKVDIFDYNILLSNFGK